MLISIIVAMGRHRVIGFKNGLPWHLPADLRYFKKTTWGKPIIMGRKTFIAIGKALPGRCNIVMTRDENFRYEGVQVAHSLEQSLIIAKQQATEEVMIIGGATVFAQALESTQRIYRTEIDAEFPGDCYFPELAENEWRECKREPQQPDEKNPYHYTFVILERSRVKIK